jgi:hypothetical protein
MPPPTMPPSRTVDCCGWVSLDRRRRGEAAPPALEPATGWPSGRINGQLAVCRARQLFQRGRAAGERG